MVPLFLIALYKSKILFATSYLMDFRAVLCRRGVDTFYASNYVLVGIWPILLFFMGIFFLARYVLSSLYV